MSFEDIPPVVTRHPGAIPTKPDHAAWRYVRRVFFAHPYSSWERGANEDMNELIRQFFPKKMNLKFIPEKPIQRAKYFLNHRPRKCLGFRTPFEVFNNELQSTNSPVALQS
ncbi:transposase [Gammaproteobacteria bacterium]